MKGDTILTVGLVAIGAYVAYRLVKPIEKGTENLLSPLTITKTSSDKVNEYIEAIPSPNELIDYSQKYVLDSGPKLKPETKAALKATNYGTSTGTSPAKNIIDAAKALINPNQKTNTELITPNKTASIKNPTTVTINGLSYSTMTPEKYKSKSTILKGNAFTKFAI
jgi:hypothetical protein